MKRGTLVTVLSLFGLVAAPAGAQMMPPGQMPPPFPGADPYAVPQGVDETGAYPQQPEGAPPGAYQQDPYAEQADGTYQAPDLDPDNEIAQSYDDGYDPQAYTQFQDALAPYGSWSYDDSYGHVWTPTASVVGASFTPYSSGGHWVRSEYGWTWVSDWNWGWAPFHYGRWVVRANSWAWVPGTMWGPAWVSWRSGNGYVGWAPLPPRGVRLAVWTRCGSPWRFTAASNLAAPRLTVVATRALPAMFARTTVVSTDRLLTHGNWTVHVNAGPLRAAPAREVQLSRVAPAVLPHVTVYPHPGLPVYQRPWVRGAEARQDPLTAGWRAGTPVVSSRPVAGRPAWSNPGPNFASRPMPGASAPAYGRPAPSFAGHPSAGAPMAFAPRPSPGFQPAPARSFAPPPSRPSFQAPPPRTFTPPPSRPSFQAPPPRSYAPQPPPRSFEPPAPRSFASPPPGPAPRSFAPPPHAFTPPPSSGGFNHVAGTAASGGVHFGAQPNHHR